MTRTPIFALSILLSLPLLAQADFEDCRDYFPERTPPILVTARPGLTRDLCMSDFAILHSGERKTPVYVVERLNRARILDAGDEKRTDDFYEEARVPSAHRARLADYRGSGYDRGHMAPAADMPTPEAIAQSFSLANMVPQAPKLNRGIWAKAVEKPTRQYAMRAAGDVFVFTGPAFQGRPVQTIGAGVWVPSHVWKLVYDATERRAWAFWIENRDEARMSRPIRYEELVRRIGIELLPGITPAPGGGATGGGATEAPERQPPTLIPQTEADAQRLIAPYLNAPTSPECGSKRTCGQMADCTEAKHYLNECGVRSLDRDGDGVPCESLCK